MCNEIGCNDKLYAKNLCQRHYNRMAGRVYRQRHKEQMMSLEPAKAIRDEYYDGLWEFVKKELKIQC